jgi:hypothetical protein
VQAFRVAGSCYALDNSGLSGYGVGDGDIQIVSSPVHGAGSTHAFKQIIYQGLNPADKSIRADLYTNQSFMGEVGGTLAGQAQFWHFAVYFPSLAGGPQRWANYCEHNVIGDFHEGTGSPYLETAFGICADTSTPYIWFDHVSSSCGYNCDQANISGPLVYDQWYDVIIYIKWSSDPAVGHATVWAQTPNSSGYSLKFDKAYKTMDAGDHPYWKQALYSGTGFNTSVRTWTNTAVFDGACRGTSFAAVAAC